MSFTVAYLKNSFTQSAMEKYRYAEWKALYAAEAGLNDVAMVVLPYITTDTLLLSEGVMYGSDQNNAPIGMYKDIACSTRIIPNTTRKEYIAYSTGVAGYTSASGTDVSIERRVYTSMRPQGFEEFMYFTHEEEPIGPGNTGNVNFGNSDQLEGKVHTNGVMSFSNWCQPGPQFSGEVNITFEAIEENGSGINWGNCDEDIFDVDGSTILDTVSRIIFPPSNSAEVAKASATHTFSGDSKLFRPGKKDTLIMTEINFADGGYWATQWWYNIPPIGNPPSEYSFMYDSESEGLNVLDSCVRLQPTEFDSVANNYINVSFVILAPITADGTNIQNLVEMNELVVNDGDQIIIHNEDNSKVLTFTASTTADNALFSQFGIVRLSIDPNTVEYMGPDGVPFLHNEPVTFVNTNADEGLNEDVEWNAFHYYHDHADNETAYCDAGRIQHFDFEYWNAGGTACDIFDCPDIIYNSQYVFMSRTFFQAGGSPQVIYIKGGQVLVRGVVNGRFTIVTDDYTEYRRHDDENKIDRVWGNIWLIDDVIYSDSAPNGAVTHPQDGGSNNVLGLIAGGSVIIANTKPNGGGQGHSEDDIIINAAIIAMNGGFISHYWQNLLTNYHDWNDGLGYGIIADGRGGHRNPYRSESAGGSYSNNNDYRGYVNLWGSIVQFKRGYMKRNNPGPYNVSPGVGYDKNYNYDWNLQLNPPPYFPDLENANNTVILKMSSYGETNTQN